MRVEIVISDARNDRIERDRDTARPFGWVAYVRDGFELGYAKRSLDTCAHFADAVSEARHWADENGHIVARLARQCAGA